MSAVMYAAVLLAGALPTAAPAALAARPAGSLAGGAGTLEIDYVRVLLALVLCLALAVMILWWVKHQGSQRIAAALGQRRGQSVRVVERVRLSPRAMLHVVEFDGQRVLVATDNNGVFRIAQGGLPESSTPPTTVSGPDAST